MTTTRLTPDGPRSLTRLLGLFEHVAAAPDGLSLAELAVVLDSPKSSLLTLLKPLVGSFHLTHGAGRYRLGPAAFSMAATILRGRRFPALIRGFMEELWAATRETVILTSIDREAGLVVYVEVIDSPQSVRYTVPAGATRPLYCSAAGRALLAFQDDAWRDAYLARTRLVALTPGSITDRPRLRSVLAEIRATGVSVSIEEAIPGAAGIAAPIVGEDGRVASALLIGGPAERVRQERDTLVRILADIAARACAALGQRRAT